MTSPSGSQRDQADPAAPTSRAGDAEALPGPRISDAALRTYTEAWFGSTDIDAGMGANGPLTHYAGIAILLSANGLPAAANAAGAALLPALARAPAEFAAALSAALAPLSQASHLSGIDLTVPTTSCTALSDRAAAARITLDLDLLPCPGGVLVLGRDISLERALRGALVESRQRLRDLVEIASDFAWETGADGCFAVISAQGALGFTAVELIGRDPGSLLLVAEDADCFRGSRLSAEVWMRDAAGKAVCHHILALPLVDTDGKPQGARGLARDITEEKTRAQDLATARHRERLLVHFFRVLRQADQPSDALTVALRTAIQALGAAGGQLYRWHDGQPLLLLGQGEPLAAEKLLFQASDRQAAQAEIDHYRALAMSCRRQGQRNGSLILWRSLDERPWDPDDLFLLDELTDQLALVIHQLTGHEELWRLSLTDSLTGLLNRRGFEKALAALLLGDNVDAPGTAAGGALIYMDLDNFKQLNDRHGHAKGDAALVATAEILRRWCRDSDLLARLGGDEFVVWMPGITADLARDRAQALLLATRKSDFFAETADPRIGMSIGIASLPAHRAATVELLLQYADRAMYDSKRRGKGQVSLTFYGATIN